MNPEKYNEQFEKISLSFEQQQEIDEQMENYDELLSKIVANNGSPADFTVELKKITDNIAEIDPSFADILAKMEEGKEEDGSEKLPGEAMMDAIEKYNEEK